MKFYPAFLNLKGKRVLVVGGGPAAAQKARIFDRCGARVELVARKKTARFPKRMPLRIRNFRISDLSGAFLVCAATDDEALNARISRGCRRKRVWVNVVDRPALCDFIVPAVVSRGPLVAAISTGGASPALAKFLRRKLARFFTREHQTLARWLAKRRPQLKKFSMKKRKKILGPIITDRTMSALKRHPRRALRQLEDRLLRNV